MSMFCRQCEQTVQGRSCTVKGVCGKDEQTAILQDVLIHSLIGVAVYAHKAREQGIRVPEVDRCVIEGLFTTVTNVNFDAQRLQTIILDSHQKKQSIKEKLGVSGEDKKLPPVAAWAPKQSVEELITQGRQLSLVADATMDEDIRSLRELLLYGLKGMAAYADHALVLGFEDEQVTSFFHRGLTALAQSSLNADDLLALVMECGKVNLRCMEVLDEAHNKTFGTPGPTQVALGVKKGPAIIVSGHDLLDLKQLLQQTEGRGVNVYTHGEMLPAHGYPELKKYKHLVGHFGTAWQEQQKEFDGIPAVILMTTNCIQKPRDSYGDRIFTTGLVAWPNTNHITASGGKKDFTPLIEKATALGGCTHDDIKKEITVGFAHKAILNVADRVIDAVKRGAIRRFFLIGGCDGAKPGRNYYTEFAQKVPQDCVILTLACGKFRFNALDFGDIGGIPRLLDCGQCNDAYSAITVAVKLAEAFQMSVNELPLSLILSWYEQKAVCILLTLLSLGIKNIRIGPSLPAFVSPNVLQILVDKFAIKPITTADQDLREILS